jgi:hypothetical protein
LKSAALGGISGGVFSGVSGAIQGVQSGIGAFEGARAAIGAAISPSNVFGGLGSRIAERGIFSAYQGPDFGALAQARGIGAEGPQGTFMDRVLGRVPDATAAAEGVTPAAAPRQGIMERFGLGGTSPASPTGQIEQFNALKAANPGVPESVILREMAASQPSLVQRFGPMAAGALAIGAATGAFEEKEPSFADIPGFDIADTGERRLREDPDRYRLAPLPDLPQVTRADILAPPNFAQQPVDYSQVLGVPIDQPTQPFQLQPVLFAAQGGEMQNFPRRMGAISGPGTGTSDDVPAMLSDGEFVMTARAVRGAGNGDRREGVKRMYDMMRQFEGGGAVA